MTDHIDILAFGAHPDDVELTVGGTLLKAKAEGASTAICHMTAGEMGTRGTPETRRQEAEAAAEILGVHAMEILGLPDGRIDPHAEAAKDVVIRAIRRHRPRLILAPYWEDLHPDHAATGSLIKQASFLSGLLRWETDQEPWRPERVMYYMSHDAMEVDVIVDIGAVFADKKRAAACYGSQFHDADSDEPKTFISRADFWDGWEARARHWGQLIGASHAEPFHLSSPIAVGNPLDLCKGFEKYPRS